MDITGAFEEQRPDGPALLVVISSRLLLCATQFQEAEAQHLIRSYLQPLQCLQTRTQRSGGTFVGWDCSKMIGHQTNTVLLFTCLQSTVVIACAPHSTRDPGSILTWCAAICVEFACSTCDRMGFLPYSKRRVFVASINCPQSVESG